MYVFKKLLKLISAWASQTIIKIDKLKIKNDFYNSFELSRILYSKWFYMFCFLHCSFLIWPLWKVKVLLLGVFFCFFVFCFFFYKQLTILLFMYRKLYVVDNLSLILSWHISNFYVILISFFNFITFIWTKINHRY